MLKLSRSLALPQLLSFLLKQHSRSAGTSSSYGTNGYGPTVPTQSLSNFQRHWNNYNQSKRSAREDAEWLREHGKHFPLPF